MITRDTSYSQDSIEVVHSLDEAINLFANEEVFIIGGAEIYRQAIEKADRLYITEVDGNFEADAFFPEIDKNIWQEKNREHYDRDDENKFDMDFVIYERN